MPLKELRKIHNSFKSLPSWFIKSYSIIYNIIFIFLSIGLMTIFYNSIFSSGPFNIIISEHSFDNFLWYYFFNIAIVFNCIILSFVILAYIFNIFSLFCIITSFLSAIILFNYAFPDVLLFLNWNIKFSAPIFMAMLYLLISVSLWYLIKQEQKSINNYKIIIFKFIREWGKLSSVVVFNKNGK